MEQPALYSLGNGLGNQYEQLNPVNYEYNTTAPFAPARDGFPISPATSYEAALLSNPHIQSSNYSAFTPTSAHAMEYVQNMYHMQFAQDIAQGYDENMVPNLPYGARTMITCDGKRKRRRIITHEQRKAANVRERRRMYHLNEAFDDLRKRVPTFAYEKKLSRIETLKLAVTYIQFMSETLEDMDSCISSGTRSPESTTDGAVQASRDIDNHKSSIQREKDDNRSIKRSVIPDLSTTNSINQGTSSSVFNSTNTDSAKISGNHRYDSERFGLDRNVSAETRLTDLLNGLSDDDDSDSTEDELHPL